MIGQSPRQGLSIWLIAGLFVLASCAPAVGPSGANPYASAPVGAPASSAPSQPISNDAPVDSVQTQNLTNYLHTHQLPLVAARVLQSSSGPHQVILYGFVATPFGKADAADQARQFLADQNAVVDNRIKIEPQLAGGSGSVPSDSGSGSNPDIQRYQDQQSQQQALQQYQSQQYQNQGSNSSGLMMMMPLLGLFGSFGGGGTGFGFGSTPYGYGSPYGSPYGGYGGGGYGGYPPGYGYPSGGYPPGSYYPYP